jgi:hypothetical protein
MNLADHLEIHSTIVVFVGLGVNDSLSMKHIPNSQHTSQNKNRWPHNTLIFCVLKLKIAGKIAVFILRSLPRCC